MRWLKLGRVYGPSGNSDWALHSALTPTPWRLNDETIRVFAGFRDAQGASRIGFVDLSAEDPLRVLDISPEPALDLGPPGAFDEHGVILGDIVEVGSDLRLYYVGFQRRPGVKFLAFSGLAISRDRGRSFTRASDEPILGPAEEGRYLRAVHSVLPEGEGWRVWYAAGDGWEEIDGLPYPRYHVRHQRSADGIHFDDLGKRCLDPTGDEYRLGRPRVRRVDGGFEMRFTSGGRSGSYQLALATSTDGLRWHRHGVEPGLEPSDWGWDSRAVSYGATIEVEERMYLFYNGNDMGRDGFGVAAGQLAAERG